MSIYESNEQGEEHEVLSDRSPIAALTLTKSYALAQASRLLADREKPDKEKERNRPVAEVFNEASERAEQRNDAEKHKPLDKAAERPAPER